MAMEKFHFTHEGKEYEIPFFTGFKIGPRNEFLEALDSPELETKPWKQTLAWIKLIGEEAGAAINDMYDEEAKELFEKWLASTPGAEKK